MGCFWYCKYNMGVVPSPAVGLCCALLPHAVTSAARAHRPLPQPPAPLRRSLKHIVCVRTAGTVSTAAKRAARQQPPLKRHNHITTRGTYLGTSFPPTRKLHEQSNSTQTHKHTHTHIRIHTQKHTHTYTHTCTHIHVVDGRMKPLSSHECQGFEPATLSAVGSLHQNRCS